MRRTLAVIAFLLSPTPLLAASAGDLVKLPDDGNPATAADAAVYYLAEDGRRYVFPTAAMYFSWYADFSLVKTVGAAEMASYAIGGNVTSRPGTRMVKITADPKAYAVDRNGVLRHVASETVAACLYGADWNRKIDDVPDAFFADYRLGAPITDCAAFDPAAAAAAAPTISVDRGLAAAPEDPFPPVPTFSVVPSVSRAPAGGQGTLMELRLRTPVAATLVALPTIVDALLGAPVGAAADADPGGLVRGLNERTNLKDLRWIDASGAQVFGTIPFSLSTAADQHQEFAFGGALEIPAGADVRLRLVADFDEDVPSGEEYRASVPVRLIILRDAAGASLAFHPTLDLVAAPVAAAKDVFEITAAPLPGETTEVRGARGAAVGAFAFRASAKSDVVVRSAAFQGYLDERESAAGFLPGGDADNGSETRVRDLLLSVRLEDEDGNLVAGPVAVPADGRVVFSGMRLVLPAGSVRTYVLRGDLSRDAVIESNDDAVAFDVADASLDVDAVDPLGNRVEAVGLSPNGGASPLRALTVREHGALSFSWVGASGPAVAGRETYVGTLTLSAAHDAFDVSTLTFASAGDRSEALTGLVMRYAAPDGSAASASAPFAGNDATFRDLKVHVPRGGSVPLAVYASLTTASGVSASGDRLRVSFAADRAAAFSSEAEGRVFGDAELREGRTFNVPANAASDLLVRLTSLSASRDSASPSGTIARGQAVEVLRFVLEAAPEGPARLRQLSFRIEPGDVGTEGTDNDALERWADVNGDARDDNEVVELRRLAGAGYDVIGEGGEAAIRYGIVRHGVADMTPQGLDSAYGDEGLIEVVFADGSEPTVAAGSRAVFALALKTDLFRVGAHVLKVRLAGPDGFLWTDRPSGFYDALDGYEVGGLPVISAPMTVVP